MPAAPDSAPTPIAPSRRALLAGAVGGLAAWAASAVGRVAPAGAAVGDPIRAGQTTAAGSAQTQLTNNSSTNNTFVAIQNGTSTAIRGEAGSGVGGRFKSGSRNKFALVATNSASGLGSGGGLQVNGGPNVGIDVISADSDAVMATGSFNGGNFISTGFDGNGVTASAQGGGLSWGVYGLSQTSHGAGVRGHALHVSGENYGVYGLTNSPTNGWAGYFEDNVFIGGDTVAPSWISRIDDPSAPTQRYLQHALVESAERLRLTSGTVRLDGAGQAVVQLPGWYAANHANVRYQLTAIGAAAPGLHVASTLDGAGRFTIAGGAAGQQVSWLLTATRADPVAAARPIANVAAKPAWRAGTYLHPELYGAPASQGHAAVAPVKPAPAR